MKKRTAVSQDQIELKQKKGIWKRFIKLFPKCNLPWFFLILYIIIDLVSVNIGLEETEYTAQLFAGDTSASVLASLIGVIVLNLFATNFSIFFSGVTSARINRNMRKVVLGKVLKLPLTFFKTENPREGVYRIVQNAVVINSTIMVFLLPIFTALYKSVSILGYIGKYDLRLTLILIGFVPVQILTAFLFGRINFSLSQKEAGVTSALTQKLAEIVANIPLAKAFAREDLEIKNGKELNERIYKLAIKGGWFDQFRDLSGTIISLLQSLLLVSVGALLLRDGEISRRAWVTFFLFSSTFSGAITEFMMYWNNIKIIQGGADWICELMSVVEESDKGEPCKGLTGDLRFDHVVFSYSENTPVLKDITCTIPDNQVTALLGISGSGKTTLVNLLTRLYDPQGGEILAGDRNIKDFSLPEYRDQFVFVSQNTMFFSGTIRENLVYGNKNVTEEALSDVIRKADAETFVNSLPNGLDTVLEEYGNNLSGGQKQRLAFARALLSDAHYMILDEPTASMDAIAAGEILRLLKTFAKDRCVILIAHTPEVLSLAERVIILEDGMISMEGSVSDVSRESEFLRDFAERGKA